MIKPEWINEYLSLDGNWIKAYLNINCESMADFLNKKVFMDNFIIERKRVDAIAQEYYDQLRGAKIE